MLLCMMILFGFGGLSQYTGLGMIVGAITAGVLTRPTFDKMGVVGEQVRKTIDNPAKRYSTKEGFPCRLRHTPCAFDWKKRRHGNE